MKRPPSRAAGFTLVELTVALVILALLAAVLFGSLNLAGTSVDRGEAKAEATSGMRLAESFLRAHLEQQHPLRMRKVVDFPLLFAGTRDDLRYAAPLPARVQGGGLWYFRVALDTADPRRPLILERAIPDLNGERLPGFADAERTVLAQDIAELKFGYYGRDTDANDANEPTWRDRWDDTQRLPLAIRIDVTPKQGLPWPTLYVTPRDGPEAGCRAWDVARQRCAAI